MLSPIDYTQQLWHQIELLSSSFIKYFTRAFSFNSPFGACETCDGLGTQVSIDPELVVPDEKKSLVQGCIDPIGEQPRGNWYSAILKSLAFHYEFNFTT